MNDQNKKNDSTEAKNETAKLELTVRRVRVNSSVKGGLQTTPGYLGSAW